MRQPSRDAGLSLEFGQEVAAPPELGEKRFDGDSAIEGRIAGRVHHSHSALRDLSDQLEAGHLRETLDRSLRFNAVRDRAARIGRRSC
jgi:hypothetical protein